MWYNQSNVCRDLNNYKESNRFLQKVLASSRQERDSALMRLSLGTLVMQKIENNEMENVDSLYQELQHLVDKDFGSSSFMVALARMHLLKGDSSQAESCLIKGWERTTNQVDSIGLYMGSAEFYSFQKQGEKAYRELLKGIELQNQEARQALQQPVLTVQRDYLLERLDFEAYKLRMEKHLRILYILFFVLLLMVVTLFLSRQLKKEKEKARKTIDELNREMLQRDKESRYKIESLLTELEDKDKASSASILSLRSELQKQEEDYHRYIQEAEELQHGLQERLSQKTVLGAEVFKNWFASISKLLLILLQKGKEETKNKKLRKEITLWQEKYYEGNKAYREVERLVNLYNDDAMLHFREEMQWTDEADYRRTCYFFAGFSIRLIAILMDETEDSVYQKRHRLRKSLEVSDLLHKDLYLVLLCK